MNLAAHVRYMLVKPKWCCEIGGSCHVLNEGPGVGYLDLHRACMADMLSSLYEVSSVDEHSNLANKDGPFSERSYTAETHCPLMPCSFQKDTNPQRLK